MVTAANLYAHLRSARLDRELAAGIPIDASPVLAVRARTLARRSEREQLGHQLRRIVREAHAPARRRMRVPIARERVLAAEQELALLASRLESSQAVAVTGLAKVRVLLRDGCGPLYYADSSEDLSAVARQATTALS
jgi:hypothetical protein